MGHTVYLFPADAYIPDHVLQPNQSAITVGTNSGTQPEVRGISGRLKYGGYFRYFSLPKYPLLQRVSVSFRHDSEFHTDTALGQQLSYVTRSACYPLPPPTSAGRSGYPEVVPWRPLWLLWRPASASPRPLAQCVAVRRWCAARWVLCRA